MKKFATIALAVVLSMGILTGCENTDISKKEAQNPVITQQQK